MSARIRRLLLLQLHHLGDVLLATPALRAARQAYPDARIDFLTGGGGADVLAGNPHADEVLVWRRGLRANLALVAELRRRRYDAVVDFHSYPRTMLLTAATGAPARVGLGDTARARLAYTTRLPREAGSVYMVRQKLALLGPLGVEAETAHLGLDLTIGGAEERWAAEVWEEAGLAGGIGPVVALAPVGRIAYKRWGAGRWAAVADRLVGRGVRVLLTYGPGERWQAAAVAERMCATPAWSREPASVRQLAALYRRCALWLGNDGGPKHLAAAAGVPTVTVIRWGFGPVWTDESPGSPHVWIDRPPPQGCDRDCGRCRHLGCLDALDPEAVIDAALAALGVPGGGVPS